jgi:ribonuclease VapC
VTLFIDASAVVALIAKEEGAYAMADTLDADSDLIWSAMARWETVSALCRSYKYLPELARMDVEAFGETYNIRLVSIGEDEERFAFDAYRLYGRGRHRASLNMGDCFAYACAKANQARILYKGNDFAQTDLA